VEFRVLGALEVRVYGRDLTPIRPQQRALLTLLLLRAGEVVTIEQAIDALWGEQPPRAARNAVQGHIASLRKLIGADRLETRAGGYVLHVDEHELDLYKLERLVTSAPGASARERSEMLTAALALFRGPPLEDFRDDEFAAVEAARIDELRLNAIEERVDADLELGRDSELVPELEALVAKEPLRERLRGQLILALYRSGRQADALAEYQRTRQTLVNELGLEPGPALQRLERQILTQDQALEASVVELVTELPVPATLLRGRERDLADLRELLVRRDIRLVTVTGTGGTGKTRVALELGRRSARDFAGGAVFVPLSPLADADLVVPGIARALGVTDAGSDTLVERIAAFSGQSVRLVVVDNFDHVLAAAPAISELLTASRTLTLLVTSREPLRIEGEHVYRLQPLDADSSIALFLERARAVRPDVDSSAASLEAVAEICRRLDHLPLAIELAAARTTLLSPTALLARLGERLTLLTGRSRDRPERQRTLRRTLEWSYETLDADERTLFARLGVFAGGWTLDAAEEVCGEGLNVIDTLASLVDKSLLQVAPTADEPRPTMLETIREFALERLAQSGEGDAIRDRHLAYFLSLAERAYAERTARTAAAFAELDRESDNIRGAADWAARTDARRALELAGALGWYWRNAPASAIEGETRLLAALAASDDRNTARLRALLGLGPLVFVRGRMNDVLAIASEALSLARDLGDDEAAAMALEGLAWAHCVLGNHDAARSHFQRSLDLRRRLHDPILVRRSVIGLYQMLVIEGRVDEAEPLAMAEYEEAVEAGDTRGQQTAIHLLADCELIRGNYEASERRYATGVAYSLALGARAFAAEEMQGVALSVAGQGDFARALRIAGAAEAEWTRIGAAYRYAFWAKLVEEHLGHARVGLGDRRAQEAWDEGASMSFEDAVEDATRSLRSVGAAPPFRRSPEYMTADGRRRSVRHYDTSMREPPLA
jgi:predicted ATPase/DNA-binding SARP family transcriptional activator